MGKKNPHTDVTAPHVAGGDAASAEVIVSVSDLQIDFRSDDGWRTAVQHVSYDVHAGEVLAIVGESGSGKTVSSMAVLGLLPANARARGSVTFRGQEILNAPESQLSAIRGSDISLIFQEPMTALNPVFRIGDQIMAVIRAHETMGRNEARQRALELLRLVELPDPQKAFDAYPHQLSGGQRQRALIAQAICCDPVLLIADEPTTALDVTVQAEILDLLRRLRKRLNSAVILITHDLGVVADTADNVIVMRSGDIVEHGTVHDIFERPEHPYTRKLLDAVPRLNETGAVEVAREGEPVLRLADAVVEYSGAGFRKKFRAVDNVSFEVKPGEIVGLVGESGSGKTTIAKAVIGLLPIVGGSVQVSGRELAGMSVAEMREVRRGIGFVFQDPGSSLNPRRTIGQSISEPMRLARGFTQKQIDARVAELLEQVELPVDFSDRLPHELSGGQRQRVGIARALVLKPKLLIADEPTSALDVSVQEKVLEIFEQLQAEFQFACLFVSHDLAVVDRIADRIVVMEHGRLVEVGDPDQIIRNPQQSYTQRLIAAIPVPDPVEQAIRRDARLAALAGA